MGKLTTMQLVLRWLDQRPRYHSEANARWGSLYDDALYEGLAECGNSEPFMNGRYRDIRRPVSLTPAGRAALSEGEQP